MMGGGGGGGAKNHMVKGHSEGEGAGGGYGNKHFLCTLCLEVHLINGKSGGRE